MKLYRVIPLFVFLSFFAATAYIWPADADSADAQKCPIDFYLIPLIETAFSGGLSWRPDWPLAFPPDSFYLQKESEVPADIELFNSA